MAYILPCIEPLAKLSKLSLHNMANEVYNKNQIHWIEIRGFFWILSFI